MIEAFLPLVIHLHTILLYFPNNINFPFMMTIPLHNLSLVHDTSLGAGPGRAAPPPLGILYISCIYFGIFCMYIKYHEMAIVMACFNCYGIPNLLVQNGCLHKSKTTQNTMLLSLAVLGSHVADFNLSPG